VNTRVWCSDLMERDHLEDLGMDSRLILKCIFQKWDGQTWTGLLWLRIGTVAGCTEWGNGILSAIKCGEFLH